MGCIALMNEPKREVTRVPGTYSKDWISFGSTLALRNYGLAIGTVFALIVVSAAFHSVPLLGWLLKPLIGAFAAPGYLKIGEAWANGRKAKFSDLFVIFTQEGLFERMLPLILITVAIDAPVLVFKQLSEGQPASVALSGVIVGYSVFAALITMLLTCFSASLILFEGYRFVDTLEINVRAVSRNAVTLLLWMAALCVLGILSALALFLPLIFWFLPVMIAQNYLLYATVIRGRKIDDMQNSLRVQDEAARAAAAGTH
jgi:uncharacterized membrane protein